MNISDTYGGTGEKKDFIAPKYKKGMKHNFNRPNMNIMQKSLCMIPFRFAIEMQNRGWILRNTIIWQKPNAMPSSAKDRFTIDFEYLFFFTKSKKYFFETQYDAYAPSSDVRYRKALRAGKSYVTKKPYMNNTPYQGKFKNLTLSDSNSFNSPRARYKRGTGTNSSRADDVDGLVVGGTNPEGRIKRTVWTIPTKPNPEQHFATYPEELCEIPLKSTCIEGGTVLDPFCGSGTTGVVSLKQKKNFIGIELNPEYIKIIEKRLKPYIQQKQLVP